MPVVPAASPKPGRGPIAPRAPAQRFRASFPAKPASVGRIRRRITAIGRQRGLVDQDLADLALAVSEAATNAVMHGSIDAQSPPVRVSVELTEGQMLVVISDNGPGLEQRDNSPGAGLGIPIIAAVTRRLDFRSSPNGTEVRMTFACPGALVR